MLFVFVFVDLPNAVLFFRVGSLIMNARRVDIVDQTIYSETSFLYY